MEQHPVGSVAATAGTSASLPEVQDRVAEPMRRQATLPSEARATALVMRVVRETHGSFTVVLVASPARRVVLVGRDAGGASSGVAREGLVLVDGRVDMQVSATKTAGPTSVLILRSLSIPRTPVLRRWQKQSAVPAGPSNFLTSPRP